VVSLEAAQKPITFLLVSGSGRYDANLSIHVADRGPHAKVAIMTQPNAPETGAAYLTATVRRPLHLRPRHPRREVTQAEGPTHRP